jgi:hypothetical protein
MHFYFTNDRVQVSSGSQQWHVLWEWLSMLGDERCVLVSTWGTVRQVRQAQINDAIGLSLSIFGV